MIEIGQNLKDILLIIGNLLFVVITLYFIFKSEK